MFTPPPPPPPPPPGAMYESSEVALDTMREILATLDMSEVPVPTAFIEELDALCAPPASPVEFNTGIRG